MPESGTHGSPLIRSEKMIVMVGDEQGGMDICLPETGLEVRTSKRERDAVIFTVPERPSAGDADGAAPTTPLIVDFRPETVAVLRSVRAEMRSVRERTGEVIAVANSMPANVEMIRWWWAPSRSEPDIFQVNLQPLPSTAAHLPRGRLVVVHFGLAVGDTERFEALTALQGAPLRWQWNATRREEWHLVIMPDRRSVLGWEKAIEGRALDVHLPTDLHFQGFVPPDRAVFNLGLAYDSQESHLSHLLVTCRRPDMTEIVQENLRDGQPASGEIQDQAKVKSIKAAFLDAASFIGNVRIRQTLEQPAGASRPVPASLVMETEALPNTEGIYPIGRLALRKIAPAAEQSIEGIGEAIEVWGLELRGADWERSGTLWELVVQLYEQGHDTSDGSGPS